MKGMVFTNFLEMVEERFGFVIADTIVTESNLPSGGAYTSVGQYDYKEMFTLIGKLHHQTGIPVADLCKEFGKYLFVKLVEAYPHFVSRVSNVFDFLGSIDNYIHIEVRKLYPDAELPHFETRLITPDQLEMIYRSSRGLHYLAEGLIEGSLAHFKTTATIATAPLADGRVQFLITRNHS